MKYINIECQSFNVASSSNSREDNHIEVVVWVDHGDVIRQFSAKEIVGSFDIGGLLDEIGMSICLDHFAGSGGLTVEDFKSMLELAK